MKKLFIYELPDRLKNYQWGIVECNNDIGLKNREDKIMNMKIYFPHQQNPVERIDVWYIGSANLQAQRLKY